MVRHIAIADDAYLRYIQMKGDLQVHLGKVLTATEGIEEVTKIVRLWLLKQQNGS